MARRVTKKKTGYWKYFLVLLIVFVLAGFAGAFFANALIDNKPEVVSGTDKLVARDKATVMIMGVDKRNDDVGRSDTLMLATLDPNRNQAALLSIPRDTRVKIKGYGFDKINSAYAYGGRELTQSTVESLLNTHIDHYIEIDIHGFVKIIDALGGIDIDVEKRMYYEDPWDDDGGLYIDLQPGMQHMDGKTAVTYVRYRDEEGDIGRIKRQQKFMKAVMDKVVSPSIIPKLPSIVSAVSDSVNTDMSITEILSFLTTLQDAKENGLKSEMVPGKPVYIEGVSYWVPDIKKTRQILASTMGITMSSSLTDSIHEDAAEYRDSLPDNAVEISDDELVKDQLESDRKERMEQAKRDIQRIEEIKREDSVDETEAERTTPPPGVPSSIKHPSPEDAPSVPAQDVPRMNNHGQGKN